MSDLNFGIGYGFIVTARNDGSIPLNAKALAKIEPAGDEAIHELVRRANAFDAELFVIAQNLRGELDRANALLQQIADALRTGEEGQALVEVARNAHTAEMHLASLERDARDE